jgi:hypothetical protein
MLPITRRFLRSSFTVFTLYIATVVVAAIIARLLHLRFECVVLLQLLWLVWYNQSKE